MNSRIWRASALAASVAVVLLLATQRAAGQPTSTEIVNSGHLAVGHRPVSAETSNLPAVPESGSLLILGSAFVVVAQQLRRLT